ncbi:MAG: ANTAR domain-containing protein [Lachnospiraceae bacterium]|nr:ANTAR domain-containing protein [Lachnospiraceae bacterium]
MPDRKDITHSILIVSGSEQFDIAVKKALPAGSTSAVDVRRSEAVARRGVLDRYYDIVLINTPLPDGMGIDFAMDIAENGSASVCLVTPQEIYDQVLDHVTDYGILVLSKSFPAERLSHALRFLIASRNRMSALEAEVEAVKERMEEQRLINKVKFLLIEKKHMTEDEAHRFIGRQAMNSGVSRKRAAEQLLEDLE